MTRTHPKIGAPPSSIGLGNDKKEWVGKSSEGKATNGPSGDAGAMRGRVLKTEVQGEGVLLASPYTKAILCHIIKGERWREKGKERVIPDLIGCLGKEVGNVREEGDNRRVDQGGGSKINILSECFTVSRVDDTAIDLIITS
jgi:hypothetical protein